MLILIGSFALCHYLLSLYEEDESFFVDKNIIELGAGCGLTGMLVAKLGGNVTITDRENLVPLIEENVNSNPSINTENIKVSG